MLWKFHRPHTSSMTHLTKNGTKSRTIGWNLLQKLLLITEGYLPNCTSKPSIFESLSTSDCVQKLRNCTEKSHPYRFPKTIISLGLNFVNNGMVYTKYSTARSTSLTGVIEINNKNNRIILIITIQIMKKILSWN